MGELINGRTAEEIKRVLAWRIFRCGNIDCDDCSYSDICSHENEERSEPDALALIERLEAAQPRWISVKEQLPDSRRNILTVNGHGVIRIMALWGYAGEKWKWIEDKKFKYYNDITHWMPLPEPPKEGRNVSR